MRIAARTGVEFVAASPDGYRPDEAIVASCRRMPLRAAARSRSSTDPTRGGGRRARALHRRLDEHGPGGGARAAPPRPRAVPDRRGQARAGRHRSRRAPLPARARRRRDHGRRALRRALARVGPGRTACTSSRRCSRSRCAGVRFDDVVQEALDSLPADLAAALRNVAIVVEDENREDPDLYGLFDGIPLTEGDQPGELPNLDLDLPATARGRLRRRRRAARRDPGHRAPRARPLLRPRRGPSRGARLRVTATFLQIVTWVALAAGAVVVGLYLFGRRR